MGIDPYDLSNFMFQLLPWHSGASSLATALVSRIRPASPPRPAPAQPRLPDLSAGNATGRWRRGGPHQVPTETGHCLGRRLGGLRGGRGPAGSAGAASGAASRRQGSECTASTTAQRLSVPRGAVSKLPASALCPDRLPGTRRAHLHLVWTEIHRTFWRSQGEEAEHPAGGTTDGGQWREAGWRGLPQVSVPGAPGYHSKQHTTKGENGQDGHAPA